MNALRKSNTILGRMQDVIVGYSELLDGIDRIEVLAKETSNRELVENIERLGVFAEKTNSELVQKINELEMIAKRTGGIEDACTRYGLGETSMRKVAEDANAVIRIGKRYLVNFGKVDMYMNSISE